MENGPAVFAGSVFALFGAGLLVWTAARLRHREPVADGMGQAASAMAASLAGTAALLLAVWCFTRI
ncbi:hypothetical protein [Streptomyces flaveus]|uniref:Uncharacterized protein n=1 Tax=Streptomyces flaveus TaxID=66370 RepID=A0A917R4K5_9ACTN|nr:hypothetical protein [Streptomyces flaveus]GGK90360.1 hypothetical protein GCM10010094_59270 [Streptomyces flaveus]